jgi:hypothetical protein
MNTLEFIKEYQGLVGTVVGSFLAIISSVFLWTFKVWFEQKREVKDNKNEIEKIFLAALRECDDSLVNMARYADKLGEIITLKEKGFDLILPPKFNRIYVNEDRLIAISKNMHHIISQQIDIASSAVKKFNGWLEQYERVPEFIFHANIQILETGLKQKEEVVKNYHADLIMYREGILRLINEDASIIKLHLLRPASALQHTSRNLERLSFLKQLEKTLDSYSKSRVPINNDNLKL